VLSGAVVERRAARPARWTGRLEQSLQRDPPGVSVRGVVDAAAGAQPDDCSFAHRGAGPNSNRSRSARSGDGTTAPAPRWFHLAQVRPRTRVAGADLARSPDRAVAAAG
jgi:hypothetical protein